MGEARKGVSKWLKGDQREVNLVMPRPQFTLRALLVAMLVVAAFFGGVRFERERRNREDDEGAMAAKPGVITLKPPFVRVYPVVRADGETIWVTEQPDNKSSD